MSAERLEGFLARIYVDEETRARFLADPRGEAAKAGLNEREIVAIENIDLVGLELAARSFARKRAYKETHRHGPVARLRTWLRRVFRRV